MVDIVILGAGAVGSFAGLGWAGADASLRVTLLGREGVIAGLRTAPPRLSDARGAAPPAGPVRLATDPAASAVLAGADLVVLAVKAPALAAAMDEVERHAPPFAPIASLLNGLDPVRQLRARFGNRAVIAGTVPFNVVWRGPAHLHRTGTGEIALERHALTERLKAGGAAVELHDDLAPLQRGKLLVNLVNPINALAGVPLHATLSEQGYRRVFAASIAEALAAFRAAGLPWTAVGPTDPRMARLALRAPDWLFDRLVLRRQNLDPSSMTSMATDLAAGRETEIDAITGEVLRTARDAGIPAPVNERLFALVRAVERGEREGGLSPKALCREVGL